MKKIIKSILIQFKKINFKRINPKDIDWRKVNKKEIEKRFKKTLKSPYLYMVLGLIVGILFTIQFKTEAKRPLNPVLFYNELIDVKEDFFAKKEKLSSQIKELQEEIRDKESALADKNFVSKTLFDDLNNQELIFGSTPVLGEGIEIVISDGTHQIQDEFSKSLTHAADLRDIVNLLWYSGAEAISINDERIIYNTSIDCIVNTIMINSNNYVPPFTIKAIGNRYDLYGVINGSGKLVDIKKRADKKQIEFDMKVQENIRIEKYFGIHPIL